jgi:hypothetical protein
VWRLSAILALTAAAALAQTDAVARLGASVEAGKTKLRFDDERGYLPWLLDALDIPVESQMLVFSKTGVQAMRTEPDNPRRIYFNDAVFVATVKGGPIEILAQDPERGLEFYLVDNTPFRYRELAAAPKPISPFARRTDCTHCHGTVAGVARTLIRSVVTDPTGVPLDKYGSRDTDSRTPFDELWGGWFVTGNSTGKHKGNTVMNGSGLTEAIRSKETSDVAALLVFEHQTRVMNLIAQVKLTGKGVDELADALLFTGDAALPEPVAGAPGFAGKFAARGPLRELDLRTRLMRYPCSYMIFGDAFQALPASAKAFVYRRVRERGGAEVTAILGKNLKDFNSAAESAATR